MAGKKKKILIADDEENLLNLVKLTLEDEYELIEARDGEEVFRLLEQTKPNLILLDVMMPKINGFDICEKLKKNKKTKDILIIILSAKGQERDIIQGMKLGADEYITKPFEPSELRKKIKEMLG